MLGHVGLNTRSDFVIDCMNGVDAHILRLHQRLRRLHQQRGVRALGRWFQRAVDEEGTQVGV